MIQNKEKGFTLIEILLVIGIIAILAVLVIGILNPVEQMRRANDTTQRQDAIEFLGAAERYNAVMNYYPWQSGTSDTTTDEGWCLMSNLWLDGGNACANASGTAVLQKLTSAGELKEIWRTRVNNYSSGTNKMYFQQNVSGTSTYLWVCFVPRSQAFKSLANNNCATPPTGYPTTSACPANCATSTTTPCFYCTPYSN